MYEDSFLDSYMESRLMGETPFFAADMFEDADDLADDDGEDDLEEDPYGFDFDDGRWDDDPSVYDGTYSEE
jgi:hypothetical protein